MRMNTNIPVPSTLRCAACELRRGLAAQLDQLPKPEFIRAWCAVAHIYPGLHADGYDDPDSGWPRVLKRFAAEAWRRSDAGELRDEEMYPSDAAWSGIFDRLHVTYADENKRRVEIAMHSAPFSDG
jgi:hypothetical protein